MGKITTHLSQNFGPVKEADSDHSCWLELGQLLEEHHLVAWTRSAKDRTRFGEELASHLAAMNDTEVCEFSGTQITDILSFCNQFERAIGNDRVRRSIDGSGGVIDALRSSLDNDRRIKRRYFIWKDAHILLKADPQLFGRLVDTFTGVAAETEYASEDLLVIQRAVFIGAPSLDMYAEDAKGQFRTWFSEEGEEPLWQCITGVDHPSVLRYQIEAGMGERKFGSAASALKSGDSQVPPPAIKIAKKRSVRTAKFDQ